MELVQGFCIELLPPWRPLCFKTTDGFRTTQLFPLILCRVDYQTDLVAEMLPARTSWAHEAQV